MHAMMIIGRNDDGSNASDHMSERERERSASVGAGTREMQVNKKASSLAICSVNGRPASEGRQKEGKDACFQ